MAEQKYCDECGAVVKSFCDKHPNASTSISTFDDQCDTVVNGNPFEEDQKSA